MVEPWKRLQTALRGRRRAVGAMGVAAAAAVFGAALLSRPGALATDAPCAATSAAACAHAIDAAPSAEGLTGKPRLVEFVSGACPACRRMAPIVADIERRCAKDGGSLVRVNVDEPEGEALASRYGVDALPTFVGLDGQGAEVSRMVGVQTPERLALAFTEVSRRACPAAERVPEGGGEEASPGAPAHPAAPRKAGPL